MVELIQSTLRPLSLIALAVFLMVIGLWFFTAVEHLFHPITYHYIKKNDTCVREQDEEFTQVPCTELILYRAKKEVEKLKPAAKRAKNKTK